jgi:flagellar biosynthesis protein FlhB
MNDDKTVLKMQYLLICKPEMMQTFDLNMPILFLLAIFIVYFSFSSPELQMILDMTAQELQETEFKTSQAVYFFFGASFMLFTLYLLMDYV